jgi:hypothetical protein
MVRFESKDDNSDQFTAECSAVKGPLPANRPEMFRYGRRACIAFYKSETIPLAKLAATEGSPEDGKKLLLLRWEFADTVIHKLAQYLRTLPLSKTLIQSFGDAIGILTFKQCNAIRQIRGPTK